MKRGARTRHGPRPNNDIEALAQKVPGFDAHRYVDEQEAQAASAAARRWPRLAGWLGYSDNGRDDGRDDGPGAGDRPPMPAPR
jgi:hypothetical protein